MSNSKNLILSVVLVIGFLMFWEMFVASRFGPSKPQTQPTPPDQTAVLSPSEAKTTAPPPTQETTPVASTPERRDIVLTNPNNKVVFDQTGARITSWQVKEKDHWVEMVFEPTPQEGKLPYELTYPLETFPEVVFAAGQVSDTEATFLAEHPNGFQIQKTFSLGDKTALSQIGLTFTNTSNQPVQIDSQFALGPGLDKKIVDQQRDEKQEATIQAEMRGSVLANELKNFRPGFIFGRTVDETKTGAFQWAGVDNDHFMAAFVPMNDPISKIQVEANKKQPARMSLPFSYSLNPGETKQIAYQLYVGPKVIEDLREVGYGLDQAVDFGFFGIISKLLLKTLGTFYDWTGNYGWAIVILTVCIQILFFPLTKKTLQHSVKMKEIQPQLKKIQAQFKQDPKRLQIETMNLYKKHGMKFMGMEGCFPMLIQIPIFFAFYQTLRVAYELRGAPWIFWITDLAVHDPRFVLPILMGAGMFLQQKLTAVAMDPAQAKMMLIMPVMFTFLFLKLPAGLVLYWVVNSLTTILVQRILQWQKKTPKPAAT